MANRPRITDLDEFAKLDADMTLEQLAAHYQCSVDTIQRTRARIGLPQRRPRLTSERKTQIEARLADGWSHAEIARTEHIDPETLRRHFPGTAWTIRQRDEYRTALRHSREKGLMIA